MNFFNKVDKNFFNDFFFIQDQSSSLLDFRGNSLEIKFPLQPTEKPGHITVPMNKSIRNNFNYFYVEIENISQEYFAFGFSENKVKTSQIIGQFTQFKNFAVSYRNNKLSLFVEKQQKFEKIVCEPERIGIGIFVFIGKIFITVDGTILKEFRCPKPIKDNGSFIPHASLKQNSHIKIFFDDLQFDVTEYTQSKYNMVLDENESNKQIKQKDVMLFIKSYLNQNGFNKTLNSLDNTFRQKQLQKQIAPDFQSQQSQFEIEQEDDSVKQQKIFLQLRDEIRQNVIQNKNWNFVLENVILDDEMKIQIKFLDFLEKYFKTCDIQQQMSLFQTYNEFFQLNKNLALKYTNLTLEKIVTDLIINNNISIYQKLVQNEHKNNILGLIFNSNNNNNLSKILAELQLLAGFQSELYGFDKSFDFANSKFQQNNQSFI